MRHMVGDCAGLLAVNRRFFGGASVMDWFADFLGILVRTTVIFSHGAMW